MNTTVALVKSPPATQHIKEIRIQPRWWHKNRGHLVGEAIQRLVDDENLHLLEIAVDAGGLILVFADKPDPIELARATRIINDPRNL